MIAVPKPANAAKRDMLRRLRYGHVIRSSMTATDPAQFPMMTRKAGPDGTSLSGQHGGVRAEKKCRNILELRAPWMSEDESERLIVHDRAHRTL